MGTVIVINIITISSAVRRKLVYVETVICEARMGPIVTVVSVHLATKS